MKRWVFFCGTAQRIRGILNYSFCTGKLLPLSSMLKIITLCLLTTSPYPLSIIQSWKHEGICERIKAKQTERLQITCLETWAAKLRRHSNIIMQTELRWTLWLTCHMITSIDRGEGKEPPWKPVFIVLGSAQLIRSTGPNWTRLSCSLWDPDPLTLFPQPAENQQGDQNFPPISLLVLRTVPITSRRRGLQIVALANRTKGAGLLPVLDYQPQWYQSMERCHNSQQNFFSFLRVNLRKNIFQIAGLAHHKNNPCIKKPQISSHSLVKWLSQIKSTTFRQNLNCFFYFLSTNLVWIIAVGYKFQA